MRSVLFVSLLGLVACSSGAPEARKAIRETHLAEVQQMLRGDVAKHLRGTEAAAHKIAPGFRLDAARREDQMRTALKFVHQPPRGVGELVTSPLTFLAAVEPNGVVLCRDAQDAENDTMRGQNFGETIPLVRAALRGTTGYGVADLPSGDGTAAFLLFASPSRVDGEIVGALVVGIPLWRIEQRISRQLQLDHIREIRENNVVLWAYVYRGDTLHHQPAAHPDLDQIVPDAAARSAGLAASPRGFTTEAEQYGRWYAFGIVPTPVLAADLGVVLVRSELK